MPKTFSWKKKVFSLPLLDLLKKVNFAELTVVKTGIGLEIFGNFTTMWSSIVK